MRKLVVALALLWALGTPLDASAQIAIVQPNVNLRVDPSRDQEPILLLEPPTAELTGCSGRSCTRRTLSGAAEKRG